MVILLKGIILLLVMFHRLQDRGVSGTLFYKLRSCQSIDHASIATDVVATIRCLSHIVCNVTQSHHNNKKNEGHPKNKLS